MEELKPVPPAPKKKPNIFVRLLAFLVTLALLLGAVAAVVYRDRLNFDSIRRWMPTCFFTSPADAATLRNGLSNL